MTLGVADEEGETRQTGEDIVDRPTQLICILDLLVVYFNIQKTNQTNGWRQTFGRIQNCLHLVCWLLLLALLSN